MLVCVYVQHVLHCMCFTVVFSGESKGVMVAPVVADVNHDGVSDLLVSVFDGQMALYDGQTASQVWMARFPNMESYR